MSETERRHIAFFHTSAVHIDTFNALRDRLAPEVDVSHTVREDLLVDVERAGALTASVRLRTAEALSELARNGAHVVVCTCSTLGPAAADAAGETRVPIIRLDAAMAALALDWGPVIGICAALKATLEPTHRLVEEMAEAAGQQVEIRDFLFEDVWPSFRSGRLDTYYDGLADRLRSVAGGVNVLVLAQPSMAPAAGKCGDLPIPVLTSPEAGFRAAIRAVGVP